MQAGGRAKQEFETFRYSNTLTAQLTKDLKATGSMSFIKNNNVQTEYKTTYYVGAALCRKYRKERKWRGDRI